MCEESSTVVPDSATLPISDCRNSRRASGSRAYLTDHGRLRSGFARSQTMIEAMVTVAS